MKMKFLGTFLALVVILSGCASWEAGNTESLLSAAGFRTRTPTTPAQQSIYASLPPYQLERRMYGNKVMYTYADPKQGLLYIGGEKEYQLYQQLGLKQQIAANNLAAAQINQSNAMMWYPWGPMGIWW